jgi:spoIIIJ-associated protein
MKNNLDNTKLMIKIEAETVELALIEASEKLDCSIKDIDYYIIQVPKKGLLGIGKKNAIIVANFKAKESEPEPKSPKLFENKNTQISKILKKKDELLKSISKKTDNSQKQFDVDKNNNNIEKKFNLQEIESKILELFSFTCFEIKQPLISFQKENNTIFILFDGKDAPLMIGREGYRYKSIAYMLSSWLYYSYNLKLKLEIGEFLKNQEELLIKYFEEEIYPKVKNKGSVKTKVLDESLIKIALKILREKFPKKYIATRETNNDGSFITIDDFFSKNFNK